MLTTILFDLDGTLLPIQEGPFIEAYFGRMARYFALLGYEPTSFIQAVWVGTNAMRKNIGSITNEQRFMEVFKPLIPHLQEDIEQEFLRFYEQEFDHVQVSSCVEPLAKQIISLLKSKGYQLILATNPLFPQIATRKRVAWANLDWDDFLFVTTYETSRFAKPSLGYYQEIMDRFELNPQECLMIGNDASEDMAASVLGMDVYLLRDGLINNKEVDISKFKQGYFKDLYQYVSDLPSLL
ncbi:MAG: HAD family hydrolase [Candidatus Izemoplasmatales bacterium]|nr:HAD family hydrolase [Candidatus Izemoplasmatales bacterium]